MSDFERVGSVHFLKPPQDDRHLPVLTEVVEVGGVHAAPETVPAPQGEPQVPVLTDIVDHRGARRQRRAA